VEGRKGGKWKREGAKGEEQRSDCGSRFLVKLTSPSVNAPLAERATGDVTRTSKKRKERKKRRKGREPQHRALSYAAHRSPRTAKAKKGSDRLAAEKSTRKKREKEKQSDYNTPFW
jgi:hypothetical protein